MSFVVSPPRPMRYFQYFVAAVFVFAASIGIFASGSWAALGIGTGVIAFFYSSIALRKVAAPNMFLLGLALLSLFFMAVTNFFSSEPHESWKLWINLVTIFLPLALLTGEQVQKGAFAPRFFMVVTIAATLSSLALGLELSHGDPILKAFKGPLAAPTDYNRGMSYLVLLSFPLMAWLWSSSRRWMIVLFVFILFVPAGLTESRASKLALVLGGVVTFAAFAFPLFVRRALNVMTVLLAGWPFVAHWFFGHEFTAVTRFPDSWRARMEIWDYMCFRLLEHPWLGWGLGTSHTLNIENYDSRNYLFTLMPAGHPHNAVIELWVELGLPGLILGMVFALYVLYKASQLDRRYMPFAFGAWTAAVCLSLVAYNFWTDSLWASFTLVAFAFVA